MKCSPCLAFDMLTALEAVTVIGGEAVCAIHWREYVGFDGQVGQDQNGTEPPGSGR